MDQPRPVPARRWPDARLVEVRRYLHSHPELSGQEHDTARYLAERLAELGLSPRVGLDGAETGVVATVEGLAGDGPTLLWRADTDALPIVELNDVPYRSCTPGVMHACGHDVHTTVGLGLVSALVARREELCGTLRFVFQPAEEGTPGDGIVGAEAMARGGVLSGVDAAFALHCMPSLPVGTLGYNREAMWAGSDVWTLTLEGTSTHGAYPQDGVDPIFVAAQIVIGLQGIVGRVIDSREACVVSVGRIEAGTAFNIIPGSVRMVGLLRTLDEGVRERAIGAITRLVEGTAAAWGARADLAFARGAHITVMDGPTVDRVVAALRRTMPADRLVPVKAQMGAEDFASFSRRVPAAFLLLGVGNAERGIVHPIHSPHFDVDERCLAFAVDQMAEAILEVARTWSGEGARSKAAAP